MINNHGIFYYYVESSITNTSNILVRRTFSYVEHSRTSNILVSYTRIFIICIEQSSSI